MRLKTSYSAREVTSLTGLTARQLQTWDAGHVFQSAIAPRRTASGGFTERRYSPIDLLELLALAELRRRGFMPSILRQFMDVLRTYFRRRLAETLDDAGELRLMTDGTRLFLRTRQGHVFDMLTDPEQPLVTGESGLPLEPVSARPREGASRAGTKRRRAARKRPSRRRVPMLF